MSDHDPICPSAEIPNSGCLCLWLKDARSDERERTSRWLRSEAQLTDHDPTDPVYPANVVEEATLAALRDIVADLIEIAEKSIRADERERIAQAIERDADQWTGHGYVLIRQTLQKAARIVRGDSPAT